MAGSPLRSPSPALAADEEPSLTLQIDAEDTTPSSTAADSAHNSIKSSASSPRPPQVRAEHVSLVCILFSRLQEPSQLMVPLPPAPVLSPIAAQFAASSSASGGSRSSHRIVSTSSTATSNMSNSVHRLTIGGSLNPNYEGSRHSEIALSDFPRSPTPGKLLDDEGRGSFYNV